MTQQEILQFIQDNEDGDRIINYYEKCYDKFKDLTKRSNQLTLYAIVVAVVFYLSIHFKLEKFELGPISIKDLSFFQKVAAPIFAYLFLEWCVLAYHRANLIKKLKFIIMTVYKMEPKVRDFNNAYLNDTVLSLLPFSLMADINFVFDADQGNKIIGLVFLPFLIVPFLPLIALYIMVKHSFQSFGSDILTIISFLVTIYMLFCLAIFYKKIFKTQIQDNKEDAI